MTREDIRFFPNTGIDNAFVLDMVGISYCDGNYRIERSGQNIIVLEYIVKGKGTVVVDGKTYTAAQGDIYIINRGTTHHYYSDADDPWEKIFFNMRGDLPESLLKAYHLQDTVVVSGVRQAHELFSSAYTVARSDLSYTRIMQETALRIHRILQAVYAVTKNQTHYSDEALRLRQYLDEHVEKNISIEELAQSIYRSKDYTIKLFKREFGTTPYAYLNEKKMDAACYLLLNTNFSVKQVAFNLGFEDQHYFSNVFKKRFSVSPKQYRDRNKQSL